ncbi:hypothetical protein VTK56DRAFT_5033 [Thermocarpiscus australiensis]
MLFPHPQNVIPAQNGSLYDEFLDNEGNERGPSIRTEKFVELELQLVYTPFPVLDVTSWIYVDTTGRGTRTQVIAEVHGGAISTVNNGSDSWNLRDTEGCMEDGMDLNQGLKFMSTPPDD